MWEVKGGSTEAPTGKGPLGFGFWKATRYAWGKKPKPWRDKLEAPLVCRAQLRKKLRGGLWGKKKKDRPMLKTLGGRTPKGARKDEPRTGTSPKRIVKKISQKKPP